MYNVVNKQEAEKLANVHNQFEQKIENINLIYGYGYWNDKPKQSFVRLFRLFVGSFVDLTRQASSPTHSLTHILIHSQMPLNIHSHSLTHSLTHILTLNFE
jgi:hypothetical protein